MTDLDRRRQEMTRLVAPEIPALRRYARFLTKDATSADDLVQDCLERTFTRWHLRRADADVRPWMFAILHNLAINAFRKDARRGPHVLLDGDEDSALAQRPTQDDALLHDDLLQALIRLPDEYRSVLALVAIEKLSYADAASVLGVPVGTIMSRLHRARARLQGLLDSGLSSPSPANLRVVR